MSALCIHFGTCGGCAFQDMPDADYRARKRDTVARALSRAGLAAEIAEIVEVLPGTRRRATLKIALHDGAARIGFYARGTHDIADMRECRVLTPKLFALVEPLRMLLPDALGEGETAELHATEADNGFDLAFRWRRKPSTRLVGQFAQWAGRNGVARIIANNDVLVELAAPLHRIGKAQVRLPPYAFLQPTREGEAFLQLRVAEALSGAKSAADLFSGCGTFALVLAAHMKVHAVETESAMLTALTMAARAAQGLKPVTSEKRDLFKRPLQARELDAFDAVVLDPPRAGAAAQVSELAKSGVRRAAYVSCDADSFARDARVLVDAGFRMGPVVPVDQFLWSEHIELVTGFERR
jgi:23S rRNA (uracil1939-C5)-methyltransferase